MKTGYESGVDAFFNGEAFEDADKIAPILKETEDVTLDSDIQAILNKMNIRSEDLKEWQLQSIAEINADLIKGDRRLRKIILIVQPTGAGKTLPCLYYARKLNPRSKYKCKVIVAVNAHKMCGQWELQLSELAGCDPSDMLTVFGNNPKRRNVLYAKDIVCTYDHTRNYLSKAEYKVQMKWKTPFEFPLEKCLNLVIIDEVHMIRDEHRGHIVDELIAMCLRLNIPVVCLTVTLSKIDTERLKTTFAV